MYIVKIQKKSYANINKTLYHTFAIYSPSDDGPVNSIADWAAANRKMPCVELLQKKVTACKRLFFHELKIMEEIFP